MNRIKVLIVIKNHILVMELPTDILPVHMQKSRQAETSFYYMGQFTVVEARNARKEDNRGRMQPITKVTMKMQHPVREDLLRYLQSNITA